MTHIAGTKWDVESATEVLKSKGYTMINPNEFVDSKHKITIYDNEEYYYYTDLYHVCFKEYGIRKFHTSNPYTIQNIKLWVKINNKPFELLEGQKYEGNSQKLNWKCLNSECGELFQMSWNCIDQDIGCSYCSGRNASLRNCLATLNPELAKEWHLIKNGSLTPYDVTQNSNKKVWWKCNKNPKHEWDATIYNRIHGSGCPYCSGDLPSEEYNLLVDNPKLCEDWDFTKNKKLPEEYCPNSNQYAWWKCKKCGHEWEAKINDRNGKYKTGCANCSVIKGEKRIKEFLKLCSIYYIPQKVFKGLVGLGGKPLSYDSYLPEYDLLIEYQGIQHEKPIDFGGKGKEYAEKQFIIQQEHDRRKKEYAERHNIKSLEIWYWDFDNIENILSKYLMIQNIK